MKARSQPPKKLTQVQRERIAMREFEERHKITRPSFRVWASKQFTKRQE